MNDTTQPSDIDSRAGDLMVNNLVYMQPKNLSLAVNRTFHRQYFQRDEYKAGQTMTIDVNSGTSFVNPANSYIIFKVAVDTGTANFGSGSAANIFKEITIRTRSGTELDRVERLNLYRKITDRYTLPSSYLSKLGVAQGFGPTRVGSADAANLSTTAKTFAVPLSALAGFFRPLKGQLIPPQLMSGLHMEIVLEGGPTALFLKSGLPTTYSISGLSLVLDQTEMTDDVQKTITFASSGQGLEYTYPRVHTALTTHPAAQNTVSIQLRKAVSQATVVSTYVLDQANILDITLDSFQSPDWDVSQWQYRLGALYFPNQTLVDTALDGVESYMQAQHMYDKLRHPYSESSVGLTEYLTGDGLLCASLEKDQSLNVSGLPINNSRTLECNVTFSGTIPARELITFLEYICVSKTFIDQTAVAL